MPAHKQPPGDAINARPWKNSLLTKETADQLQNPVNYFWKIVHQNDAFGSLYEEIIDAREKGKVLEYLDKNLGYKQKLNAFLVVQDIYGCHWMTPVSTPSLFFSHELHLIKLHNEDPAEAYIDQEVIGTITMTTDDYISACSRGFENASLLFLGKEAVKLEPNYRLIAAFYLIH